MTVKQPFDADDIPGEPPAGCPDPDGWSRAYEQIVAHQLGEDGLCRCGEIFPCAVLVAAIRGLMRACGVVVVAKDG